MPQESAQAYLSRNAITPTFTERDLREAEQLLANAAADLDMGSVHSRMIRDQVFDGAPMTPAQLATALQRNFRVTLDPPRLAAIVGIPCGNL